MDNLIDLSKLLKRALADSAFRTRLLNDPVRTARSIGTELTGHQSAALQRLREEIRNQANVIRPLGVLRARVVVNPILLPLRRPRAAQIVFA